MSREGGDEEDEDEDDNDNDKEDQKKREPDLMYPPSIDIFL